jgi:hypothetical protein
MCIGWCNSSVLTRLRWSKRIHQEKRLKKGTRTWKISCIEKDNPNWIDLLSSKLLADEGSALDKKGL